MSSLFSIIEKAEKVPSEQEVTQYHDTHKNLSSMITRFSRKPSIYDKGLEDHLLRVDIVNLLRCRPEYCRLVSPLLE